MSTCTENAICIDPCQGPMIGLTPPRPLSKLVANSPFLSGYKSLAKRLGKHRGESHGCLTITNPCNGQLLAFVMELANCDRPSRHEIKIEIAQLMHGSKNPDDVARRLYTALMQDAYFSGFVQFNVAPVTGRNAEGEAVNVGALQINWQMIDPALGTLRFSAQDCNDTALAIGNNSHKTTTEGFIHGSPAFCNPSIDPSLQSVYRWDAALCDKLQFAGFVQECVKCQTNTGYAAMDGMHLADYGYGYTGENDCPCGCVGCGGEAVSVLYEGVYALKIVGNVPVAGTHVLAIAEDGNTITLHTLQMAPPKGFHSLGVLVSIVQTDGCKVAIKIK